MASIPILKPKELIRALSRSGFYIHHQTGSHARLLHKIKPELRVTVPVHSKNLPKRTLNRILKQADLTMEEFQELLKG